MVKGYSEHNQYPNMAEANRTAAGFRKRGYGARVDPKIRLDTRTGERIGVYVVMRSDRKLDG